MSSYKFSARRRMRKERRRDPGGKEKEKEGNEGQQRQPLNQ